MFLRLRLGIRVRLRVIPTNNVQLTTTSSFVIPTNKQSGRIAASTIYRAFVVNNFPDEDYSQPQMTQISADDCLP